MAMGYLFGFALYLLDAIPVSILTAIVNLTLYLIDKSAGTHLYNAANAGSVASFFGSPTFTALSCIGMAFIFLLLSRLFLGRAQRWIADRERTRHWHEEPVYRRAPAGRIPTALSPPTVGLLMPQRHWPSIFAFLLVTAASSTAAFLSWTFAADRPAAPPAQLRTQIDPQLKELNDSLTRLRTGKDGGSVGKPDLLADAEVFAKGVAWALRYDASFTPADETLLKKALERGRERVAALTAGEAPVDGSQGQDRSRLRLGGGRLGAALRRDRAGEVRPDEADPVGRGAARQQPAGRA